MGKFFAGVVVMVILLFVPAGTLRWRNGWLLMALLFVPMFLAGLVLMAKNPELLQKRLHAKEEQGEQKVVIALSAAMFLTGFTLAGLSYRFGWLALPRWLVHAASAVFLHSYMRRCCGRTPISRARSRCSRGRR